MKVRKSFIRVLLYAFGALALQGVARAETITTVSFKMDGSAVSAREAMITLSLIHISEPTRPY